jgi:hypothetical protein
MQIPTSDHLTLLDGLKLFLEGGGFVVILGMWRLMRKMERRTFLLSLEHEDLIGDLKDRKPGYERPGEKLVKAKKAMAGNGGF